MYKCNTERKHLVAAESMDSAPPTPTQSVLCSCVAKSSWVLSGGGRGYPLLAVGNVDLKRGSLGPLFAADPPGGVHFEPKGKNIFVQVLPGADRRVYLDVLGCLRCITNV